MTASHVRIVGITAFEQILPTFLPIYEPSGRLKSLRGSVRIDLGGYANIAMSHEPGCNIYRHAYALEVGAVGVTQVVHGEVVRQRVCDQLVAVNLSAHGDVHLPADVCPHTPSPCDVMAEQIAGRTIPLQCSCEVLRDRYGPIGSVCLRWSHGSVSFE